MLLEFDGNQINENHDAANHDTGVWDVFGPNEAVELVMDAVEEGLNAAAAAQRLCQEAVDRAIDGEDGEADNTSAAVIIFKQPPPQ